jgi:hypothetical protein
MDVDKISAEFYFDKMQQGINAAHDKAKLQLDAMRCELELLKTTYPTLLAEYLDRALTAERALAAERALTIERATEVWKTMFTVSPVQPGGERS